MKTLFLIPLIFFTCQKQVEQPSRIEVNLSATISQELYNTYDFYYFIDVYSDVSVNAKVIVGWETYRDTVQLNGMGAKYFTQIKSNRVASTFDGTILGVICGDGRYHFKW